MVQQGGGVHSLATWFDALEYMHDEMKKIDFDIAFIGCGAYGLPLASYAKNLGKQALHMGGATQLLFAIKGRRWEVEEGRVFKEDFWVNPSIEERPEAYLHVENGCYW